MLVSAASFTILTGAVRASEAEASGTVRHTFRSAYDILVRPPGTATALERSSGLIQQNYLSGIFGGITVRQYHQIAHLPGVQVAAPIAMLGYVLQDVSIPVDLTPVLARGRRSLFTFTVSRRTDRGLTSFPADESGYVYVTPDRLTPLTSFNISAPSIGPKEQLPGGKTVTVCAEPGTSLQASGPFDPAIRTSDSCWSLADGLGGQGWGGRRKGTVAAVIDWPFPFLLAAVDPAAEARLAGLKGAVVSGRYLTTADKPVVRGSGTASRLSVPVLVSTRSYQDDTDNITVRRLPASAAQQMTAGLTPGRLARLLRDSPNTAVLHTSVGATAAYRQLLAALRGGNASYIDSYWTVGPVGYRKTGPKTVRAVPVTNPASAWASTFQATGYVVAPSDSQDTAFRRLHPHVGNSSASGSGLQLPQLRAVGQFDPARLPEFSQLTRIPLGTYNPPVAAPGNQQTASLLGGRDLLPDGNLAGYLQPPPLMLTTLRSIPAFTNPAVFRHTSHSAPLSVIRVRVAGVTGPNKSSLTRIEQVATLIHQRTGLKVDITAGSSPTPVTVQLPAGSHGRPPLSVTERWVSKGVAVAILSAVDRKSLALFSLIFVVCALFIGNAAAASVRARRTELGVLACLGWRPAQLFTAVLGELVIVGAAGGIVGLAAAWPVSRATGVHPSALLAGLTVPAAILFSLLAGLPPARRAARSDPADAVRPAARPARRAHAPRTVGGLALINVLRTPARSLAAALALAVGLAALTLLLAITAVFHGAVVGTLLGNAVAVQVRGVDYVAVVVIIVLGAGAVADVLYLGIRERAAELAALSAAGWRDATITRLVLAEGWLLGAAGSLLGAAAGAAATATAFPAGTGQLTVLAVVTVAAGLAAAGLLSVAPAALVRRLPLATALSGE